jgi:hypothetical protein
MDKFHEKRALNTADALLSVSQFTADTTNAVFHLDKKFSIIQIVLIRISLAMMLIVVVMIIYLVFWDSEKDC